MIVPVQNCRAAFIFAREYWVSSRVKIKRAASCATRRRIRSVDIVSCAETKPVNAARGVIVHRCNYNTVFYTTRQIKHFRYSVSRQAALMGWSGEARECSKT